MAIKTAKNNRKLLSLSPGALGLSPRHVRLFLVPEHREALDLLAKRFRHSRSPLSHAISYVLAMGFDQLAAICDDDTCSPSPTLKAAARTRNRITQLFGDLPTEAKIIPIDANPDDLSDLDDETVLNGTLEPVKSPSAAESPSGDPPVVNEWPWKWIR